MKLYSQVVKWQCPGALRILGKVKQAMQSDNHLSVILTIPFILKGTEWLVPVFVIYDFCYNAQVKKQWTLRH